MDMIKEICFLYDIDFDEIKNNSLRIKKTALQASRRMTTARFVDEMKKINPDISILGEYTFAHKKIKCKCNKCGYEWEKAPAQLRTGAGCPICSKEKAANNHHITSLNNGINSLETMFPDLAKEWDFEYNFPLTPADVTHASSYKAGWICPKCGNHFVSTVNNRTSNGGKLFCPQCRYHTANYKAVICIETMIKKDNMYIILEI